MYFRYNEIFNDLYCKLHGKYEVKEIPKSANIWL